MVLATCLTVVLVVRLVVAALHTLSCPAVLLPSRAAVAKLSSRLLLLLFVSGDSFWSTRTDSFHGFTH